MKRFAIVIAMGGMAVMTALPSLATESSKSHTMSGYISDSKCGATHMGSGAACVKKCIAGGEKPVFVDHKKNVWAIDNPKAVPVSDEGEGVDVTVTVDATKKSIHVENTKYSHEKGEKIRKTMIAKVKSDM